MKEADVRMYKKLRKEGYAAHVALGAVRGTMELSAAYRDYGLCVGFEADYDYDANDDDCDWPEGQEFYVMVVYREGIDEVLGALGGMDTDNMADPNVIDYAVDFVRDAIRELNTHRVTVDGVTR